MSDKPYMDEHQLLNARIDDISKQNAEILQEVMNTQKLHIGVDLILKKIKEQDYALSILNKKLDVLNYTFDNFIRCVNETKDNSRQILKEMKIADT